MSPVLTAMGVSEQDNDDSFVLGMTPHFNAGASDPSRLSRFEFLRKYPLFRCPENQALAGPYPTSPLACSVDVDISYYTAANFLSLPYDGHSPIAVQNNLQSCPSIQVPSNYGPFFGRVKNSSNKICVFCGEVFTTAETYPDIDLNPTSWSGGGDPFTDPGAYSQNTRCIPRNYRGGPNIVGPKLFSNGGNPLHDFRPVAFLHGNRASGGKTGTYAFTAVMYDGHAEVLDDLTAANPSYWVPTGTILNSTLDQSNFPMAELWTDAATKYGYVNGSANTIP